MTTIECAIDLDPESPDYARLKKYVLDMTGLAYYADRDDEFASRIHIRLNELKIHRFADYFELLSRAESESEELDRLTEYLTIGETHFFRHQEVFNGLSEIIAPSIFRADHGPDVRIWTAGCSIGAETYSVAITLKKGFCYDVNRWNVSILGTDINRSALRRARRAEYTDWDLRGTDEDIRASCFTRSGKTWRLNDEYRQGTEFQYHNLVRHPYPTPATSLANVDVILCRNVLMYFDSATVRHVIQKLHDCLDDGGWLVVGHAEPNVSLFSAFQTVNAPGVVLYRKMVQKGPRASHEFPGVSSVSAAIPRVTSRQSPVESQLRQERSSPGAVTETKAQAPLSESDRLLVIREVADQGDLAMTEALCKQWLRDDPIEVAPLLYLGLLSEQRGEYLKAAEILKKVVFLEPGAVMGHYHLGLVLRHLGEMKRARLAFRAAERALSSFDESVVVPFSEGLTAGEFRKLVRLELMNGRSEHRDN